MSSEGADKIVECEKRPFESVAWRIALYQLKASPSVKAKMLDFRSAVHHAIRDCDPEHFNISADGRTIVRRQWWVEKSKDVSHPLWRGPFHVGVHSRLA